MRLDGAALRRKVQASSAAARRKSLSPFCRFFLLLIFPFQKGKKNCPQRKWPARQPVTVPGFGREIRVSLGKRNIEIRREKKKENHEKTRTGVLSPVW